MAISLKRHAKIPVSLALLIAVQCGCVVFFVSDLIADFGEALAPGSSALHLGLETIATLSLLAAIMFEARYLYGLVNRKAQLEHSLQIASAEMQDVIDAHFEDWGLSPSETDVATFLVKGLDILEIAEVRGCAEGTVKAHLNAIYRKSGTHGRGELLSAIIDSLMVERARPAETFAALKPHFQRIASR